MRKPLSLYHPGLYWLRVWQRRICRSIHWRLSRQHYALNKMPDERLLFRYIKHTSKLIRRLGDSDLALQHNKIINLRLAVRQMNGIIISPGEYFSFCRLVGQPTARRGFVEGMELSFGKARAGIGGGLCQLSNLIHWMVLHSPLTVVERSNHSFDPFPDDGRTLPFGSGAAIFYNFVDLVLHNPTDHCFQIMVRVGEKQLEGELLCDSPSSVKYHVYQQAHRFYREGVQVYRENEIWRDTLTKGHHPQRLASTRLYSNKVIVKYPVDESCLLIQDQQT